MKKFLIDRLKERSTWLGILGIVTAAGLKLSPELQEAIITSAIAVAGIIAAITADKPAT